MKLINRVTGESAMRSRKRAESINESEMTMAERLGEKASQYVNRLSSILQQKIMPKLIN